MNLLRAVGQSRRARAAVVVATSVAFTLAKPGLILGQSPNPAWYMYDSRPYNGQPPIYPGEPTNPHAYVVEGLGAGQCGTSTLYTEAKIEGQTVNWVNASQNTVTEITPQATCASLATYEAEMDRIVDYVEAHAAAKAPQYWAGLMIDEEPGFSFTASQLESLNNHHAVKMGGTPGLSWFFLEDQPNGWVLATYNAILNAGAGWPAPQVYSQSMANAVNSECSTYSQCRNLVTVWTAATPSWNDPEYTYPRVNGPSWYTSYSSWFPGDGWWNGYRNQ
jgi:hypothetical protein